jgi:hypothetical protein
MDAMSNLLNMTLANQEKARKANWIRYVQLLELGGGEEEARELAEIMEKLGRSAEQAKVDAANLQRIRGMQRAIRDGSGPSYDERSQKATIAVQESYVRMCQAIEELRHAHQLVVNECNLIGGASLSAREHRERLRNLTASEPELVAAAEATVM